MDPTCAWSCRPTTTNNPDNNVTTTTGTTTTGGGEDKYCIGSGTDMYMQGFAVGIKTLRKYVFT